MDSRVHLRAIPGTADRAPRGRPAALGPQASCGAHRFSTRALPERERLSAWRETFGRAIVEVDTYPLGDGPFLGEGDFVTLPGVAFGITTLSPSYGDRTPELIRDGRDDVGLLVATNGSRAVFARQRGRERLLAAGEGVVMRTREPARVGSRTTYRLVNLAIPEAILAPLVSNRDALSVSVIPADTEALRLLVGYVELLRAQPDLVAATTAHLAATHIQDLAALAIGATREAAETAAGRGLSAARLAAVKADIAEHLGHADLSVTSVARRQGISPVYVRKLFQGEGTTFAEFVRGQRLVRAYRALTDPRLALRTITEVALDVGFADLSYFNRCFRRQFDASPSEIRAANRGRA